MTDEEHANLDDTVVAGPPEGAVISAYGKIEQSSELSKFNIRRRKLDANDINIEIAYCGICHTDIHFLDNEWGFSKYPLVPGHEISGYVKEIGTAVLGFTVGQTVAVGCIVSSCGQCSYCQRRIEQYCQEDIILTYNSKFWRDGNTYTLGGFSKQIVVNEK